jgi:hypothetical protein
LNEAFPRGSDYVEMSHHFTFADDDAAGAALHRFGERYHNSAIADRWVAPHATLAHEVAVYRRSIEFRRSWTKVADEAFELPTFTPLGDEFDIAIPTPGPGDPASIHCQVAYTIPDSRGAVTVMERGGGLSRRCYVGPLSPIAAAFNLDTYLPSWFPMEGEANHTILWTPLSVALAPGAPVLSFGDYPLVPGEDSVALWRDSMATLARTHVADMVAELGELGGVKVIPSWVHNRVEPVEQVNASRVRAELGSRSRRAPTIGWVDV